MNKCLFSIVTLQLVTLAHAGDYAAIRFEERKQHAEEVAQNLRVDGDARDWGDYPARYSVWGNGGGDPSRDIISTRVFADAGGTGSEQCPWPNRRVRILRGRGSSWDGFRVEDDAENPVPGGLHPRVALDLFDCHNSHRLPFTALNALRLQS